MDSRKSAWGRTISEEFFNLGGFSKPGAVFAFKEKFLALLENSSLNTRDFTEDAGAIALGALVLLEAGGNDQEIHTLLLFIGALEKQSASAQTHWLVRLALELIKTKHSYERHTAWHAAESLDFVVADCVETMLEHSVNMADDGQCLDHLNKQSIETFGHPVDLEALTGLRDFLQVLRNDGSASAAYLLLILRLENPDFPSIIESLNSIAEESTPLSQLAKFHLAVAFELNQCPDEAAWMFQSLIYDFDMERHEAIVQPLLRNLRDRAESALNGLTPIKRPAAVINIDDLMAKQIYSVEQCISECKDLAQSESPTMLTTWVSTLAVETGKLAEAFWKCCLVAHIQGSNPQPPVRDIISVANAIGKPNKKETNKRLLISLQNKLGYSGNPSQKFYAHFSSLINAWNKNICIIEFLNAKQADKKKLQILETLFRFSYLTLKEDKADYPTLVLANIFSAAFNANHPLASLSPSRGYELISSLRHAQDLRNKQAHYSGDSANSARFQLQRVLRSSESSLRGINWVNRLS